MPKWMIAALIAVPLGAVVAYFNVPTTGGRQVQQMQEAARDLPPGASQKQVAALIHRQGLGEVCSYHIVKGDLNWEPWFYENGLRSSQTIGYYELCIRDTTRTPIGTCFTYVCFPFDKHGKLIKTVTEPGCIGL